MVRRCFALNRDLGRLHALAPQIKENCRRRNQAHMGSPGLMLICAEIGMLPEARAIFQSARSRGIAAPYAGDDMYVTYLVCFARRPAAALADAGHAESLYQLLRPLWTTKPQTILPLCASAPPTFI